MWSKRRQQDDGIFQHSPEGSRWCMGATISRTRWWCRRALWHSACQGQEVLLGQFLEGQIVPAACWSVGCAAGISGKCGRMWSTQRPLQVRTVLPQWRQWRVAGWTRTTRTTQRYHHDTQACPSQRKKAGRLDRSRARWVQCTHEDGMVSPRLHRTVVV